MEPRDIVLVTCTTWPELSVSDRCLADELSSRGHRVRALPWNGAALAEFTGADLVVLRSNWDYHHDLDAFLDWLAGVEAGDSTLRNSAPIVREHLDKSYVERLLTAGIPAPRTLVTSDLDLDRIGDWADTHDLDRLVLKPAWGASGHGVELVARTELASAVQRWRASDDRRAMVVQEFMPQIRRGESALVFFGAEFSHALLRRPADDDFRVNSQYGGTMELQTEVEPSMIEFAAAVVAALSEPITYARIDVVSDGTDHVVMEVEINEPALGLHLAPGSEVRFADALLAS